jgi:epoxide hydrolase-like predicted phosphatase
VPKAAIFDFGGVLTTPVWDSFASFCREQGLNEDAVKDLFRSDPEALADLRELEMGRMAEVDFERRFAERLGLADATDLIESLFRGMSPDEEMLEGVRAARADGIRTGLLSNSWSTTHYDRDLLGELFDAVVISGEVGLHKPQPEIYRLVAERLGVEPRDCVFVDDLRDNCDGAEAVGMRAVLHRDTPDTLDRLGELLGVSLETGAGR